MRLVKLVLCHLRNLIENAEYITPMPPSVTANAQKMPPLAHRRWCTPINRKWMFPPHQRWRLFLVRSIQLIMGSEQFPEALKNHLKASPRRSVSPQGFKRGPIGRKVMPSPGPSSYRNDEPGHSGTISTARQAHAYGLRMWRSKQDRQGEGPSNNRYHNLSPL
jgi:hypothetical protein